MIDIKEYIRTVVDHPIPGIQFRDISGLIENTEAFNQTLLDLTTIAKTFGATKIIGIDSRGFVFGAPVARDLDIPFIMARKPGKLPGDVYKKDYELEYGTASLEIQTITDIKPSDVVVIVDRCFDGNHKLSNPTASPFAYARNYRIKRKLGQIRIDCHTK